MKNNTIRFLHINRHKMFSNDLFFVNLTCPDMDQARRERKTTQTKKKRKSRTAFTNSQIFELEKRFIYQKYVSPADRDEIAQGLGLSNNQVSGTSG